MTAYDRWKLSYPPEWDDEGHTLEDDERRREDEEQAAYQAAMDEEEWLHELAES